MRINLGSGQRPFGVPHPEVPPNHACEFCREGRAAHERAGATAHPRSEEFYVPHRYVPSGPGAWLNLDIQDRWEPDIIADGAHMPMFADNSVEMIVSHHSAEHLTLGDSQKLFQECHRILAPGGSLLVFVPDLNALCRAWIAGKITDYIFCVNLHGAYMNDDADIHRWSFTGKSLRKHLMTAAQWRTVKPFDWRKIQNADLARDWWILSAEAVK